jgi:hypothetical protein
VSSNRFNLVIQSYYDTRRPSDSNLCTPKDALPEFTNLYKASRLLIDEISRSKEESLTGLEVRALGTIVNENIEKELPQRFKLNPLQRLKLNNAILWTFQAHALFDPQIEDTDENLEVHFIQDAFTQGLRAIANSFQEALSGRSTIQQILSFLGALALSLSMYYFILTFWIPLLWHQWYSTINPRGDHDTGFGLEPFYISANQSAVILQQQLKSYDTEMNSTMASYEYGETGIIRAVDFVLHRTEILFTQLTMMALTIWFSKIRPIKPLFRLLDIASEASVNGRILRFHESYLSDIERELDYPD